MVRLPVPRRSLSQPPAIRSDATEICGVGEQFRLDPRYADWYYAQRVRPSRYPPPVATQFTVDLVDAARHHRTPGSGLPVQNPSPPLSSEAWEHGRESESRDDHRPAPLDAKFSFNKDQAPVTPQMSPEATPGHSRTTVENMSMQTSPIAPVVKVSAEAAPAAWSETRAWKLPSLTHRLHLTGISNLPNKPVQGDTRESSACFQRTLLMNLAESLGFAHDLVEGMKLKWDKWKRCQADDATVGFSTVEAASTALQAGSFTWGGCVLHLAADPDSPLSVPTRTEPAGEDVGLCASVSRHT
eukprot:Hpha_TRINITY_DN13199_c1_g2::TRINITY_DN13199_c1_g2_i1::g.113573::m.113573